MSVWFEDFFMDCQSVRITKTIEALSWWRRWLTCHVFNRRKWRTARAYSRVTIDMVYMDHPLRDEMWDLHERAWADVYGIVIPTSQNNACGCESGVIRSLGRDNDEIIEDCPKCTKKLK